MYLYYYRYILTGNIFFANLTRMKNPASHSPSKPWAALESVPPTYQRLQAFLSQTHWIAQGTVVRRSLVRRVGGRKVKKGPYYLWTSKVRGKTFCLALSKQQYQLLAKAIEQNRAVQKIIQRMQTITLQTILRKVPGVRKRK